MEGTAVGVAVGSPVGSQVGSVVGTKVGVNVGSTVGATVGSAVGMMVGMELRKKAVGSADGASDGSTVGETVMAKRSIKEWVISKLGSALNDRNKEVALVTGSKAISISGMIFRLSMLFDMGLVVSIVDTKASFETGERVSSLLGRIGAVSVSLGLCIGDVIIDMKEDSWIPDRYF